MTRSPAWLALATLIATGAASAQTLPLERGSSIGTPLPVGKVEPAPIAPPPYSDAEKAALAKLDELAGRIEAERAALAAERAALALAEGRLVTITRILIGIAAALFLTLLLQLWLLRRPQPRTKA